MSIYIWWTKVKEVYVWPNKLKEVYVGWTKVRPTIIDRPWIYHNPTEWLISISKDWTNWITIADKNLWATQVYNNWDTLKAANVWNVYQRWNNYWFPYTWSITVVTWTINASSYWPWNYYSSSTFRYYQTWYGYWDSSENANLWWDTTNTKEARRWPCQEGFHIASKSEWWNLISIMTALWLTSQTSRCNYLKIPKNWYRRWNDGWTVIWLNSWTYIWASTPSSTWSHSYDIAIQSSISNEDTSGRSSCLVIRPLKNTAVIPTWEWTVLYQPS